MKTVVSFLVALVLLSGSVSATSFLNTRGDYYKQARVKLGYDTASTGMLTDTTASLFLTEAVTSVLALDKSLKRITSFVTSYRQSTYATDTTLTGIIAVWWSKNDSLKTLRYSPINEWFEHEHKSTQKGDKDDPFLERPSYYDFTDSQIVVFPVPVRTTPDTLKILGWHRFSDISASANTTAIPEHYRISILYYMVWAAADSRNDPRAQRLFQLLNRQLSAIGLRAVAGGEVASGN